MSNLDFIFLLLLFKWIITIRLVQQNIVFHRFVELYARAFCIYVTYRGYIINYCNQGCVVMVRTRRFNNNNIESTTDPALMANLHCQSILDLLLLLLEIYYDIKSILSSFPFICKLYVSIVIRFFFLELQASNMNKVRQYYIILDRSMFIIISLFIATRLFY